MRLIASIILSALVVSTAVANTKVIYGDDNRLDVFAATNSLHVELSRSTAAMISGSALSQSSDVFTVRGSTLRSRGMCASERFANQMTAARCSGFLVGPDLLVTAGHCVRSSNDCRNYKWVFDYKQSEGKASINVPITSVYGCAKVIEQSLDRRTMDDYALIKLDRKVTDRTPLTYRNTGKVEDNAPLVVIGHPTGLPTKIAAGANVRNNNNNYYFVSNLDTYGGNSGSAVFNSETGLVEGILVRGETDYIYDRNQGCRVSNLCTDSGCRGEDVTRITNISALLDKYVR